MLFLELLYVSSRLLTKCKKFNIVVYQATNHSRHDKVEDNSFCSVLKTRHSLNDLIDYCYITLRVHIYLNHKETLV